MFIEPGRNALRASGVFMGPARLFVIAATIGLTPVHGVANGGQAEAGGNGQKFCSRTANLLWRACQNSAQDDYWTALAICTNVSDAGARGECLEDAKSSRSEANQLCREQLSGRLDACDLLGESRYDPDFAPASFENDFTHLTNPNRYFPLGIGNRWEYRGGGEVNTVEVLNETKLIDGVRCVVFRDRVFTNGNLTEDTADWFAQAKDGNVWYCGEQTAEFETFKGDRPMKPELVGVEGSFKAGREGDKPGIIFLASPAQGDVYLEEFSLGNAEDVTQILSTTYAFGRDHELDRFVPRQLANLFCSGDCVVTRNFSLLEPGVSQRKYYAPGIGVFLEVDPETGDKSQLVSCNFDTRCATLKTP
jgi:hypothetical protein